MNHLTGISELDEVLRRSANARTREEQDEASAALAKIAPRHIESLVALYDADSYPRMPLVWCLIGQTNDAAFGIFSKAIGDRDQYVRWAAAEALSKYRTRKASALLVSALKDRSHLVKQAAVKAMTLAKLRSADAIPQLKKITQSPYLQASAPGLVGLARQALDSCRNVE